jgi:hypothetical protein
MKNAIFWDVTPCGSWKNRRFEELFASIIRAEGISELGATLEVSQSLVTATIIPN